MQSPANFKSFEAIKARYIASMPLAKLELANNPSQLLDRLVRYELFRAPRRNYREVMLEVLDRDPELKRAYSA